MQPVEQALNEFGREIGLNGVAFDGAGNLTLVFDSDMALNFARRGETALELWTSLPEQGRDTEGLRHLLVANHLGEGTGAARLALQPNGGVVLCERVEARGLSGADLSARVLEFVRYARFWRSAQSAPGVAGQSLPDAAMLATGSVFRA